MGAWQALVEQESQYHWVLPAGQEAVPAWQVPPLNGPFQPQEVLFIQEVQLEQAPQLVEEQVGVGVTQLQGLVVMVQT